MHSFWYDEATRQFQLAIAADPKMRMAYWGAAMSYCKLLWGEDDLDAAIQILKQMPDPDSLPPREQAWLLATFELLKDEGDAHASRVRFAKAMEAVHAQFPDDESTTFLAVALLGAMRPEDPDAVAIRKRAADLALSVYQHNPKHPGAAHYLIHALDTPALVKDALPVAREYARIAPAAFHARHMPAHVFSRLGMWPEAIASCQAAWDASLVAAKRQHLSADHDDFHSLNWLIEMELEIGARKAGEAALDQFGKLVQAGLGHELRALYASQVSSYLMRTGAWQRADELLAPLAAPSSEDSGAPSMGAGGHAYCGGEAAGPGPLIDQGAMLDARAHAAAMQHDAAATRKLLAELDAVETKLRPFLDATQPKPLVLRHVAGHERRRRLLTATATGDDRTAINVLREIAVAEAEADTSGGETRLSGYLAREQLADLLLKLGQAKDAAREYAAVLAEHPNRARSLLGAARAASKLGDRAGARERYQQLLTVWAAADPGADGLTEAKSGATAP
jgi:tetratricopeptide (TPR) repeat protein